MNPDLFQIPGPWRGRLFLAPRPRGGDWLADEMDSWRRAGINVLVSLLEPEEAEQLDLKGEPIAAGKNNIDFIAFPIPDRGIPGSTGAAVSLMTQIGDALEKGENVAIHCRQAIGRSGLIAAGVLMMSGASPEEALERITATRGVPVPETPEQRLWVDRLASRVPVRFAN
ncbi:MAG: dual specificity protein phosphatase family protein [Acidobacteriia bacterium]|nr:dual specificity protein phosphatase family protein [Terriglobia bacterium]